MVLWDAGMSMSRHPGHARPQSEDDRADALTAPAAANFAPCEGEAGARAGGSAGGRPLVSLVIPCFNEPESYLEACFSSITNQTYPDFEVLVIDESSDLSLAATCAALCARDPRFHYLRPPRRIGLPASLNMGLAAARGAYIGRADADDVQEPDRLASQVSFLERHPDIGVLGCALRAVDDRGDLRGIRSYPLTHRDIVRRMQVTNTMAGCGVMLRASVVRAHGEYDASFKAAEDLELWLRLIGRGVRFANLAAPLVVYRQETTDRNAVNWRENLRARLRHFSGSDLPLRLLGLAIIAAWSLAPSFVRRGIYARTQLSRDGAARDGAVRDGGGHDGEGRR